MNQELVKQLIDLQCNEYLAEAACKFSNCTNIQQLLNWVTENNGKQEYWKQKLAQHNRSKEDQLKPDSKCLEQAINSLRDNQLYKQLVSYQFNPVLSAAAIRYTNSKDIEKLFEWIERQNDNEQKWKTWLVSYYKNPSHQQQSMRMDMEENNPEGEDQSKDEKIISQILDKMFENDVYKQLMQLSLDSILCAAAIKSTKSNDIGLLTDWVHTQANNLQKWRKWLIENAKKPKAQMDQNMLNAILSKNNSLGLLPPNNQSSFNLPINIKENSDEGSVELSKNYPVSEDYNKKKQQIIEQFKKKSDERKKRDKEIRQNRINYLKQKYSPDYQQALKMYQQDTQRIWKEDFGKKVEIFQKMKLTNPSLNFADIFGTNANQNTVTKFPQQLLENYGNLDSLSKYKKLIESNEIDPIKFAQSNKMKPQTKNNELFGGFQFQPMTGFNNFIPSRVERPAIENKQKQMMQENIMQESELPQKFTFQQEAKFESLKRYCDNILKNNTNEKSQLFYQTLIGCIQKIVEDFENPKYRKIKKSNPNTQEKLLSCSNHMEVLQSIGFEDTEQFLILNPEARTVHELNGIKKVLDRYTRRRKRV